ncbi:MAG: hypothetical protein AAB401_14175 [Acidobacteriota bacterium]
MKVKTAIFARGDDASDSAGWQVTDVTGIAKNKEAREPVIKARAPLYLI